MNHQIPDNYPTTTEMKWSAFSSHRLLSSKLQQKVVYKKSCLYTPLYALFNSDRNCPYRFQLISNTKKIENLGHFLDFKEEIARDPLKLKRKSQGAGLSSGQLWCLNKKPALTNSIPALSPMAILFHFRNMFLQWSLGSFGFCLTFCIKTDIKTTSKT